MMVWSEPCRTLLSSQTLFIYLDYRVATAFLVAGPTLTLWIPGQTLHPPARTRALFKVYQYNGLFQLMQSSSQDMLRIGYTSLFTI